MDQHDKKADKKTAKAPKTRKQMMRLGSYKHDTGLVSKAQRLKHVTAKTRATNRHKSHNLVVVAVGVAKVDGEDTNDGKTNKMQQKQQKHNSDSAANLRVDTKGSRKREGNETHINTFFFSRASVQECCAQKRQQKHGKQEKHEKQS